jgi:hypothetical protein
LNVFPDLSFKAVMSGWSANPGPTVYEYGAVMEDGSLKVSSVIEHRFPSLSQRKHISLLSWKEGAGCNTFMLSLPLRLNSVDANGLKVEMNEKCPIG